MELKLAILIDAENVVPGYADTIFSRAAALGEVVAREIYGTAAALTTWAAPVLKYAIHPNLTIKAAKGKNSSDIALVIGAMDLLNAGALNAAIIVSSDSDFSALSVRLRNAGIEVIGMGTDKSNELWRMACSSFVVLELPKAQDQPPRESQSRRSSRRASGRQAASRQAAPVKAAPPEPAPEPEPVEAEPAEAVSEPEPALPARHVATTHRERIEIIGQMIARRIEAKGGRLQVSTLFPSLNKLPEYQADRQGSGRKPLNYLTSTYGDIFTFETMPDGNCWVALKGEAPAGEAPAGEPGEALPEEAAPTEEVIEVPEDAAPVEVPAEADEIPAAEEPAETAVETPEPAEDAEDDTAIMTRRLIEGGMAEDVVPRIVEVYASARNLRAAYNELRTVFGNTTGREYYNQVKQIMNG